MSRALLILEQCQGESTSASLYLKIVNYTESVIAALWLPSTQLSVLARIGIWKQEALGRRLSVRASCLSLGNYVGRNSAA